MYADIRGMLDSCSFTCVTSHLSGPYHAEGIIMINDTSALSTVVRRCTGALISGALVSTTVLLSAPAAAQVDSDGDGLTDQVEQDVTKSDPYNRDSDGDGLDDRLEVNDLKSNPNSVNSDLDSLTDAEEYEKYHTDPFNADTDGDGLNDDIEALPWNELTDPFDQDTDDDGLSDGDEVTYIGTDPKKADYDRDGVSDGREVLIDHTDPFVAGATALDPRVVGPLPLMPGA